MPTRSGLVAKKCGFSAQKDDEKWSRRQKSSFRASKRRREGVSSPKSEVSWHKTTTRSGLVAKKVVFALQNDDEKWSRRQKMRFCSSKRRRERVSSPKNAVYRLKRTTRKGFVAKKMSFLPQNDDEKWSRRQKRGFPASKRRREKVSSPKNGLFRHKTTTRSGLVAKKCGFAAQKDDEKWSRRQKVRFRGTKRRREVVSSPKIRLSRLKNADENYIILLPFLSYSQSFVSVHHNKMFEVAGRFVFQIFRLITQPDLHSSKTIQLLHASLG